jgi:hypothetical protein
MEFLNFFYLFLWVLSSFGLGILLRIHRPNWIRIQSGSETLSPPAPPPPSVSLFDIKKKPWTVQRSAIAVLSISLGGTFSSIFDSPWLKVPALSSQKNHLAWVWTFWIYLRFISFLASLSMALVALAILGSSSFCQNLKSFHIHSQKIWKRNM